MIFVVKKDEDMGDDCLCELEEHEILPLEVRRGRGVREPQDMCQRESLRLKKKKKDVAESSLVTPKTMQIRYCRKCGGNDTTRALVVVHLRTEVDEHAS